MLIEYTCPMSKIEPSELLDPAPVVHLFLHMHDNPNDDDPLESK